MILLYGGGSEEVGLLRRTVRWLSEGVGRQFALNDLTFVQSVGKCRLLTISAATDLGVMARESTDFEWTLRPESWLHIDEQLEPFCKEMTGGVSFQYLNPSGGPEIIYSTVRGW